MQKIKRLLLISVTISILISATLFPAHALPATPSVSAKGALLMEADSGTVVFSKAQDTKFPMASTTKLMTALTALQLSSPDTEIVTDRRAVGIEGSSIYLIENERLTLEQLLYALLLESANDAAAAIAFGLSGSIEAFAEKMNQIAHSLGLRNTHFTNPHGLDDEEHYTTPYELALIARAVLENDLLRTIVATRKTTIPHAGTDGVRLLVNHNKLLRLYDSCIGMKTGFTQKSGRCLVSAAERDGVTLIAVTLCAPDDWDDHTRMLDYGFTQFRAVTLCRADELAYPMPVVGGTESVVMLTNGQTLSVTLPANAGKVSYTIEGQRFAYATVCEGEILAHAVFRCDTNKDGIAEIIGTVPLASMDTVEQPIAKKGFFAWLMGLFSKK